MTLRKLISEKYQAKQIDVFKAESKIIDNLKAYLIPRDPKKYIPFEPRYGLEEGFRDQIDFTIPSINAFLSSSIHFDSEGRERGGGKVYDFRNRSNFTSEIKINFSYLEGTSEEDLTIIRDAIKSARLKLLTKPQT